MIRPAIALVAAAFFAAAAYADDAAHRTASPPLAVTQEQAIATAKAQGMVRVEDIELDDGKWEVEGRTESGREIEVDVSARTGEVLRIDYDD